MEIFFYAVSLALFLLAILTFVLIVREALPLLNSEDQLLLRNYWKTPGGLGTWRRRDLALKRVWSEHARNFPNSRKPLLFAVFLITAAVSVMFDPLWLLMGRK